MVMEYHSESFRRIVDKYDCETQMRALNAYSAALPWIGMYIAAASLVCGSLMAADLYYAIRWRKYWFPSKYFILNAATLTLLGVAVKLLLDINSPVATDKERVARLTSLVLMLILMGKFASLSYMDGKSVVSNMIALVILAVTVSANLIIQVKTGLLSGVLMFRGYVASWWIVHTLLFLINSAVYKSSFKKSSEDHYRQKYELILNEERLREGRLTTARLELVIKKLWIMAVTTNPQFSPSPFVWAIYLYPIFLAVIILLNVSGLDFKSQVWVSGSIFSSSDYSWSIIWILVIQSFGISIGVISFVMRLIALIFQLNNIPLIPGKVDSMIMLHERYTEPALGFLKCRNLLASTFFIIYQNKILFILLIPIVMFCKILAMMFYHLARALSSCLFFILVIPIVKLKDYICAHRTHIPSVQREQETEVDVELARLAGYAFQRPFRLSKMEINFIYYEQHQLIRTGRRQQPSNLFQLLQRSANFIGVNNFDHIQVTSLLTKEPPTCWTLPVMTLARIAIALPQENSESLDNIIKSVTEGLKYADFVHKSLEAKQKLRNIRYAVKVMWLDVELDHKSLNVEPITRTSHEAKFSKEILQDFAGSAKNTVDKFKEVIKLDSLLDPIYWPSEVLAANSMYRISSTLLMAYDEEGNAQITAGDDDGLLEKILNMIADILSACLTNLPYVMIQECSFSTIGKMEDRARQASRLFGEWEEILELLESREVPQMDPEKALCIDEWQAYFSQGNAYDSTPIPNNMNASPSPEEEHVVNAVPSLEIEHVANPLPSPEEEHVANPSPSPEEEHVVNDVPSPNIEHVVNPLPSPEIEHVVNVVPSPEIEHVANPSPSPEEHVVDPVPSPEEEHVVIAMPSPEIEHVAKPSPSPEEVNVVDAVPSPEEVHVSIDIESA